jgi:DNA-binding NarL/FixJ family response regulator
MMQNAISFSTDSSADIIDLLPDCKLSPANSWQDLITRLADDPKCIIFHIDMIKSKGSISEFLTMLESFIKFNTDKEFNVGVIIESDTPLASVKEIQKNRVLGIIPSNKSWPRHESKQAITELMSGNGYWPKHILNSLIGNTVKPHKEIQLTNRQQQVYELIAARGLSNKQIARILKISESTVKIHVSAILKNLCVRNRTQLALSKI